MPTLCNYADSLSFKLRQRLRQALDRRGHIFTSCLLRLESLKVLSSSMPPPRVSRAFPIRARYSLAWLSWGCPDAFPSIQSVTLTRFPISAIYDSRELPVLSHELPVNYQYIPVLLPVSSYQSYFLRPFFYSRPGLSTEPAYGHPEARSVLRRTL